MEGRGPVVPHLPDELVVEILARLPAKSLCRFKCVSRSWRRLICDPAHRAKLAQTVSGFFVFPYHRSADECLPSHFVGLSAGGGNEGPPMIDTALSFLPPTCGQMELLDSCNGLLLLLCWGAPAPPSYVHPFYVVCNPATREWLHLPKPSEVPGQDGDVLEMGENKRTRNAVLGFDPAISLNFHVFQLLETECQTDYKIEAVEIYSSESGRWILSKCGWGEGGFHIFDGSMTYLNSALHFTVQSGAVAAVDTKGEAWRVNRVLPKFHECYGEGFILHSQGRLLYMFDDHRGDSLSVYVLEDRGSEEWTFKHNISKADLFGQRKQPWWPYYDVVAFHPDANLIFIYDRERNILIFYCMTHMDVHVISTIGGEKCSICTSLGTECTYHLILPYIPQYSRTLVIPIVN